MSKNALIIDDSRLACRVMVKMLDTFGIQSAEVYSAESGLEYLKHTLPDVIFLDHSMPGMSGLEMMKIIKDNPLTANIPVLMHTAKEGESYVKQALALGAAEVLPKGLEEFQLFKILVKFGLVSEEVQFDNSPQQSSNELAENIQTNKQTSPQKVPAAKAKPTWQLIWQQKIEPYFDRQKRLQQQDLEYRITTQTRKLTREIHLTLEQFEHALVLRLESHADFVASTEADARSMRKKLIIGIGLLVLLFQIGIFWHLWRANEFNQELLLAQQRNEQIVNDKIDQLTQQDQKITELILDNQLSTPNLSRTHSLNTESTADGSVDDSLVDGSLVDSFGTFVSDIYLVDQDKNIYRGVTPNGYRFMVDSQGFVGENIGVRYYLTANCEGDIFVNAPAGVIFKDSYDDIWYVDKHAESMPMNMGSKIISDNNCVPSLGNVISLRALLPNISAETGIEQHQTMRINLY